jgi:hypothetical protein
MLYRNITECLANLVYVFSRENKVANSLTFLETYSAIMERYPNASHSNFNMKENEAISGDDF